MTRPRRRSSPCLFTTLTFSFALVAGCATESRVQLPAAPVTILQRADATAPVHVAVTCFLTGEQVSGMNKICYYNCLGSTAAITIGSTQLCPLSINQ